MRDRIDWKYLMDRFAANTCTREEFERLLSLVEKDDDAEGLAEEMRKYWDRLEAGRSITPEWKERFDNLLRTSSNPDKNRATVKIIGSVWYKWAAAAAVIIALVAALGNWNWNKQTTSSEKVASASAGREKQNIAAGKNRALLILADGSSISLDAMNNGTLAIQDGVKIIKGEEGEILYYAGAQKTPATGYNTIITPRGGKYSVLLSDGTKVWLNAASSLKFPVAFTAASRDVVLTGEGYFDVTKNPDKPFRVKAGDINVRVLGTEFNINAYKEEGLVSTTLVEGSLKVDKSGDANASHGVLLKPGEQANSMGDKNLIVDRSPNMDEVLAWKNGKFEFVNTPVPVILREISRWYDVDIVFRGSLPDKRLTGTFSREVDIDQLVEMLRYAGINISIENKRLLILPK
jgi:ferric-dicitrate binding protein FerR (iron transport regulator)